MRITLLALLICSVLCANSQDFARLYQAEDFTAENMFTNNIEGPSFDKQGRLFVVNFQQDGTIGYVKPDGKAEIFVTLPTGSTANAIQFDAKGNMLLADFSGHNVLKVDMKSKHVSVYVHDSKFNQPNDICINKAGQVFASDPNWKESTGQIWRIDGKGKAVVLQTGMGTTNGIELSPDEKTLYVNESVQRKVWAFDVDKKGNLSNKRLFTEFPDFGLDGMKCDAQGNLYVARWGKGAIAVFTPQGALIREVMLKGKNCSNLVFGGLNGKLVYVTLQDRKGMELFRNDIPGKGF